MSLRCTVLVQNDFNVYLSLSLRLSVYSRDYGDKNVECSFCNVFFFITCLVHYVHNTVRAVEYRSVEKTSPMSYTEHIICYQLL